MRVPVGIALLVLGMGLGAGGVIAFGLASTSDLQRQLDDARFALNAARVGSQQLERGLDEARGVADASAKSVADALVAANAIADRGARIIKLVEAIRGVVADLKRIAQIIPVEPGP